MAQVRVQVEPNVPVVVKLEFEGVARYAANIYEAIDAGWTRFRLVRTLASDGSSMDARPDELEFDAPPAGAEHLFFLESNVTHPVPNRTVSVTASVHQGGRLLDKAHETGAITTGYVPIVTRIVLAGDAG